MRSVAHLRRLLNPYPLLLAFAFALSATSGAISVSAPRDLVAALLLAGAVALALTRPATLFMLSLALLAVEPTKLLHDGSVLGRPETLKLVLYACTLPLLLNRGLDRRKLGPLIAYVAVTVLAAVLGTPLAGLSYSQTLASLATLALGGSSSRSGGIGHGTCVCSRRSR